MITQFKCPQHRRKVAERHKDITAARHCVIVMATKHVSLNWMNLFWLPWLQLESKQEAEQERIKIPEYRCSGFSKLDQ